jgi:hypothetical protein
MAKDLVRTRNYVTRFIEMKTHLNAVSLKMQVISPFLLQVFGFTLYVTTDDKVTSSYG